MSVINSSEDFRLYLLNNPPKIEVRFHPKEKSVLCKQDFYPSIEPIIYYRYDDNYTFQGKLYYSMTYYMYYRENYAIGLNGIFPYSKNLGYHEGDLELIKVLFDIDINNNKINKKSIDFIKYIFFSAHAQEGEWKNINDCEINENHIVVYVAYGSHANKPKPGTYLRIFGFANDYTSKYGKWERPKLINDQNTIRNIKNKEVLSSLKKRFFMPFYLKYVDSMKKEQQEIEYKLNNEII